MKSVFDKPFLDLDPDDTTIRELNSKLKKLEQKYDKATTQLVSYEATIGYLKDALEKIANDRSPPWDKTDFQRVARECLEGLRK